MIKYKTLWIIKTKNNSSFTELKIDHDKFENDSIIFFYKLKEFPKLLYLIHMILYYLIVILKEIN